MTADEQYQSLGLDLLQNGVWKMNDRTGKRCLTTTTKVFEYDVGRGEFPLITTRQVFPKMALAEPVGYWQGLSSARDFRLLGTRTWDANANKTKAWLGNKNRIGEDDMGRVYGWFGHNFGGVNQFEKVYNNLRMGIDDRGEIITYWKPDEFEFGCLRPCLHSLQFNLLGDTLHMTASQRSTDVPLGLVSNMPQCYEMLALMSRVTGNKAGVVTHILNQPHLYEDQLEMFEIQMKRTPMVGVQPKLEVSDTIQVWDDIMDIQDMKVFTVTDYESHPRIDFPFSE